MPACPHLSTPNSYEFGYAQLRGLLAILVFCTIVRPLIAADTVIYRTAKDPTVQATVSGAIVDFVGGQLSIRNEAGIQQTIPAERVVEIRSEATPAETAADQLARDGKHEQAAKSYQQAVRDEKRVWVQRQVIAKLVGTYCQLEQFDSAGDVFLSLLRNDPHTHFFAAIPLSWMTHSPSPQLAQRAAVWMSQTQNSVSVLLGASWLLPTDQRAAASASLQRLITGRDPRVAMLAQTQLWRTRTAAATVDEIEGWEASLTRLPADLRAGPYVTLGQAWSAKGQADKSASAYLRVPILYGKDRRLVAAALLLAGRELEKIDQREEAVTLYREVVREHAATPAAAEARSRLEELGGQERQ